MDNLIQELTPYFLVIGVIAINVVIIAASLFFGYQRRQAMIRAWGEVGMRAGLILTKGSWLKSPELSGEYRRRPLHMNTFERGSNRSRQIYTRVALTVENATGSTLGISPASAVGNFFGKVFNTKDVQIGNPEFDSRFTVKSAPETFAGVALDDSMTRMGIAEITARFEIELRGSTLTYTERGVITDADRLQKLFDTLSSLADRVEGKKRSAF